MLRVDAYGFIVIGERFLELSVAGAGQRPIAVDFGPFRAETDRLGVIGDGLIEIALVEIHVAPVEIGDGVSRVLPDDLVRAGERLVESGQRSAHLKQGDQLLERIDEYLSLDRAALDPERAETLGEQRRLPQALEECSGFETDLGGR